MSDEALGAVAEMARSDRLYPALILHGATATERREAAGLLARVLLCESDQADRPCGACKHCRRLTALEGGNAFHPDLHLLERDQKTVTSIEATRSFLRAAQMAPFEARGQVFVICAAETLGPEAADTLLKILEEPPPRTPRHFLLLAPSSRELSATLRSRSMSLFLGFASALDESQRTTLATAFGARLDHYLDNGSSLYLMSAAAVLQKAGDWSDLRAAEPWSMVAGAVVDCATGGGYDAATRRALLSLAEALLEGRAHRVRGIAPQRILEGLVLHHLGGLTSQVAAS